MPKATWPKLIQASKRNKDTSAVTTLGLIEKAKIAASKAAQSTKYQASGPPYQISPKGPSNALPIQRILRPCVAVDTSLRRRRRNARALRLRLRLVSTATANRKPLLVKSSI